VLTRQKNWVDKSQRVWSEYAGMKKIFFFSLFFLFFLSESSTTFPSCESAYCGRLTRNCRTIYHPMYMPPNIPQGVTRDCHISLLILNISIASLVNMYYWNSCRSPCSPLHTNVLFLFWEDFNFLKFYFHRFLE
jgi:hypothetical protein